MPKRVVRQIWLNISAGDAHLSTRRKVPVIITPSEHSLNTLETNGASQLVADVAIRMTECLRSAADDMADSTGEDLFDDATSRGQLLYRRGRNRVIAEFAGDDLVEVSTADNALHVLVDECALSFYSATNGIDQPSLDGTSRTKRSVVDEMQMQLEGMGVPKARRLVLMHEADEDGLLRAAVGVLRAGHEWVWRATMYDRLVPAGELATTGAERGYEEQEEPALPPIQRRDDIAANQPGEQQSGS